MSAALHPRHPRSLVESKSITHIQKAASPADKIKFKTIPSCLIRGANARHPQIPKQRGMYVFLCPQVRTFASNALSTRELQSQQSAGFWSKWTAYSAEMSSKLAKLGLVAVLAYGLFDGVAYTSFFILAFLGYEKSMGKNPAASLQELLGDCHIDVDRKQCDEED